MNYRQVIRPQWVWISSFVNWSVMYLYHFFHGSRNYFSMCKSILDITWTVAIYCSTASNKMLSLSSKVPHWGECNLILTLLSGYGVMMGDKILRDVDLENTWKEYIIFLFTRALVSKSCLTWIPKTWSIISMQRIFMCWITKLKENLMQFCLIFRLCSYSLANRNAERPLGLYFPMAVSAKITNIVRELVKTYKCIIWRTVLWAMIRHGGPILLLSFFSFPPTLEINWIQLKKLQGHTDLLTDGRVADSTTSKIWMYQPWQFQSLGSCLVPTN